MAENKTTANDQNVDQFLDAIEDERKRNDSLEIVEMLKQVTGMEPKMWGSSIIGFGSFHYKYESGREGDSMLAGFSPRKQNLTFYNMNIMEKHGDLLEKLGKYSMGKGCLYIKRLDDVDVPTLKQVFEVAFEQSKDAHTNQ